MAQWPTVKTDHSMHVIRACAIVTSFSLLLFFNALVTAAESALPENQGLFLVATKQLENTRFQEAVILLTHYSEKGATGLTINRPTNILLKNVFPHAPHLQQRNDSLYMGGPVNTNAIFVLLRTNQPGQKMHRIAKNIYFSTGQNAFSKPLNATTRTYAGYSGWAPKQLQNEIKRGDWILVHTEPNIIFEKDPRDLWLRLSKRWSGQWL